MKYIDNFVRIVSILALVLVIASCDLNKYDHPSDKNDGLFTITQAQESHPYPDYAFGSKLRIAQLEMDIIYARAERIASCEGFYKKNSVSQRNHSPGNLKAGEPHDQYGHTIYPNDIAGWVALHSLLYRHKDETLYSISRWYATASDKWYQCVTNI